MLLFPLLFCTGEFRTQFTRDGGMLLQSSQGIVWVNDAKKIFLRVRNGRRVLLVVCQAICENTTFE